MLSTQFSPCCEALYRVSLKYLNNVRSTMDYVKIRKKLRYPFHSTMFYQAAIRERKKTKHFGVQTSTIPPCTMKKLNVHVPNGLRNEQKSTAHSSIYPIMQKHGAQDLWQKRVEKEEKREQNARRKKKKRERTSFRKRIAKRNCHSRDAEAGNRNGSLGTRSTDSRIARDPLGDGKTDQRRSNASH